MKSIIIGFILLSAVLLAEEVQLNLPERFDVSIPVKPFPGIGSIKKIPDIILHVNGDHFRLYQPRHKYIHDDAPTGTVEGNIIYTLDRYISLEGSGSFHNGVFEGFAIRKNLGYMSATGIATCPQTLIDKEVVKFKITGKSNYSGQAKIKLISIKYLECLTNKEGGWNRDKKKVWFGPLVPCYGMDPTPNYTLLFSFQLPINQSQSSQTFIPDPQAEPEPIQKQPVIIPKTDLTAEAGVSPENQIEEPTLTKQQNPCTPPIDDAWKEYCEAKAYNAKIKQQEEADTKAAEQEAKEEEEYQKRLDAWNEEERQSNIAFIKSQEAEREKADKIWQEEDKAFNESIAKDQAERRAKQAEIEKAHKIIDRFGGDYATQSEAHKKIDYLAQTADAKQAKRIKNAVRKRFYDSRQTRLQGEAEFYNNVGDELGKSAKRAETIRDTAVNAEKVIAMVAVPEIKAVGELEGIEGEAIKETVKHVEFVAGTTEKAINAIGAYSKDGLTGAVVSVVKDTANDKTFNLGGDSVDQIYHSAQLHTKKGALVPEGMKVYDKNGYLVKRIKANERYFDKKGKNITFSVKRKVLSTQPFIAQSEKDFKKGDANKKVNTVLNIWSTTTGIVGGAIDLAGKVLRK